MFETEWQQIRKLLANKNGWSMKNIYYLQNEHARQKAWMLPYFGPDGRIFRDVDVSSQLDFGDIRDMLGTEWDRTGQPYLDRRMQGNPGWSDIAYAYHVILPGTLKNIMRKLSIREIASNKLENINDFRELKGVQKGMKVSKLLKLLLEKFLLDSPSMGDSISLQFVTPTHFQDYVYPFLRGVENPTAVAADMIDAVLQTHSKVVEKLKNGGHKLVISINPIDMMFASNFTEGWTSCYRLFTNKENGPGMYASAPLVFTSDAASAIAFTTAHTADGRSTGVAGMKIPTKTWRAFVHFTLPNQPDPNVWIGRQYKGQNDGITRATVDLLKPIMAEMYGIDADTIRLSKLEGDRPVFSSAKFCYTDASSWALHAGRLHPPIVGVEQVYCAHCGSGIVTDLRHLRCDNCKVACCAHCGGMFKTSQLKRTEHSGWMCPECFEIHSIHVCIHCNHTARLSNGEMTPQGFICRRCKHITSVIAESSCTGCGAVTPFYDLTRVSHDTVLCPACFEEYDREQAGALAEEVV
jgi:hypothetical protein